MAPRLSHRRRALLLGLVFSGLMLVGCHARPPTAPEAVVLPDREVGSLDSLFTAIGNRWLLRLRPSQLLDRSWVRRGLQPVVADERLQLLSRHTGIDLRKSPELIVAMHRQQQEEVVAYAVRHANDALAVERKFRKRLNGPIERAQLGHQLSGVWGHVGTQSRALASIGRNVALFQYGGNRRRGQARIALLYAQGKLKRFPRLLEAQAFSSARRALEDAPALFAMVGPFEGDYASAVRGLLAQASALLVALQPDARGGLLLQVRLVGDFSQATPLAKRLLHLSWNDLATSDLGHLLGLQRSKDGPQIEWSNGTLGLRCRLNGRAFLRGLADITAASIQNIMKPLPQDSPPSQPAEPGQPAAQSTAKKTAAEPVDIKADPHTAVTPAPSAPHQGAQGTETGQPQTTKAKDR
jgi:hypothetical protein